MNIPYRMPCIQNLLRPCCTVPGTIKGTPTSEGDVVVNIRPTDPISKSPAFSFTHDQT